MATVIAVALIGALAAFMAGEKHGIRVERNRAARQHPEPPAEDPAGPGHLNVRVLSQPGTSATLRRIK